MNKTLIAGILTCLLTATTAQAARPCTGKDIYGDRNEAIVYGVITGMSGNTEEANLDVHITSHNVQHRNVHYSLNDNIFKYQPGPIAIEVGNGWSKPLPNRQTAIFGYDGTACYISSDMKP